MAEESMSVTGERSIRTNLREIQRQKRGRVVSNRTEGGQCRGVSASIKTKLGAG